MAVSIRASKRGLEIVDNARRRKGWTKSDKAWYDQSLTSASTLKRFWSRKSISRDNFISICQEVGISDWEKIVDVPNALNPNEIGILTPLALPTQPVRLPNEASVEILYPKQNSIIGRTVEVSAVTENISEDLQKWLIVYAPGARKYYPNEIVTKESKWKEPIIVGSVDCYGADFKILLFITNIEGSNYLKSFSDGMKQLPPGIASEVVVHRAYILPEA